LKWENIIDGVIRFETEKNQRKINIKLNPKLYNILKYYTPLKEFYKNPFEYKSLNFEETEKWYPNINGLIQSELDYINFRIEHTPKEFRIINELFQHFPEKVLFQEFNEDIKGELELIIKTRDYYIENFINSYSKRTKGPLFPYFKNGETDVRKIKNRKESSNAIVNKSLKLVSRECNITPISFHEARHTFAYHARRNGFDVFLLSRALGHSSIAITQNYLNDFDNEEIMEKNEILIDGLNNYYLI
jgi:integrase